ncbi:GNAT family N-acetyltransferase [Sabulilitoribacter arenilitoris]|uniref:GNAT family N-acetyltransferase n=1 Tax=Wocania arenilitoris TaxID=2044858 RepID=A0AAE3ER86_9FLAO|nr:GNAT family N-acetyltransferase [Wocania arenilitoris]MCF7568635.1 GNAT family N-acetyltransferase [Wocania arenilitoris]
MAKTKYITFLKALLTGVGLPPIYHTNTDSNGVHFDVKANTEAVNNKHVFVVKDIPDYLNIKTLKKPDTIIKKVKTLKGHLVELYPFKTISEYLNQNFSSKSKSNLRRYNSRLETCFNIKYVSYYGDITKQEYDRLFVVLKDLLIRRFEEKQEANYELQHLDEFHEIVYQLILDKKASLFVIYDANKPISIRINMFNKFLAFYILSGYDIDYSKFHLGSIDMLKNIEWCIDNEFKIYDLLKGYDYYKTKWATKSHDYYNHIIYNTNPLLLAIKGTILYTKEKLKYKIYNTLKYSVLRNTYKSVKTSNFNNRRQKNSVFISDLKVVQNTEKTIIDIEKNKDYAVLRKPVYDFLFLTKQSINDIVVSKLAKNKFLLQSKTKTQLLTIIKK